MSDKVVRLGLMAAGAVIGYRTVLYILRVWGSTGLPVTDLQYLVLGAAVGALVGLLMAPAAVGLGRRLFGRLATFVQRTPSVDIVIGTFGLVVGMLIAIVATFPLPRELPLIGGYLPVILTFLMGYVGLVVAVKKRHELSALFSRNHVSKGASVANGRVGESPKVLDTSVIIDGRIADICSAGFLEGPLVVPAFVLEELQHIADSPDSLKRTRGRRGLDILAKMQKSPQFDVQIVDQDFEELSEVDSKLVRLAQQLGAKVLTNDFNLNKVAELQGVAVLNINELSNALKPVMLPGEEMRVQIIKDGKEYGQGIAYLDDGTMVVVDGGRRYIGNTVPVIVTNVLQSAAGRMIFAKPRENERVAGV